MVNRPPRIGTIASSGRRTTVAPPVCASKPSAAASAWRAGGAGARRRSASEEDARTPKDTLRPAMALLRALMLVGARRGGRRGARRRRGRAARRRCAAWRSGCSPRTPGWSYRPLLDEIARRRRRPGRAGGGLVSGRRVVDANRRSPALHAAAGGDRRRDPRRARRRPARSRCFPSCACRRRARPTSGAARWRPRDRAAWWQQLSRAARRRWRAWPRASGSRVLSVGSELSTLDGAADRAAWAATVAAVRRVFPGALIYSGNWDHYPRRRHLRPRRRRRPVRLLRARRAGRAVDRRRLTRGWRDLRVELERFFARPRPPIVFTELGYRSIRGAAAAPWDEGAPGTVDLDEQRRCYEAFRRVWHDAPPDASAASTSGTGTAGAARRRAATRRATSRPPTSCARSSRKLARYGQMPRVAVRIVGVDDERVGLRRRRPAARTRRTSGRTATCRWPCLQPERVVPPRQRLDPLEQGASCPPRSSRRTCR